MKLNFQFNKGIVMLLFLMTTSLFVVNAHSGLHRESNEKVWQLENSKTSFSATFISFQDESVFLKSENNGIIKLPITDFSMEDQLYVLDKHQFLVNINSGVNLSSKLNVPPKIFKISKQKGGLGVFLIVCFFIFIGFYLSLSKHKRVTVLGATFSLLFLILIACSTDDATDDTPGTVAEKDSTLDDTSTDNGDSTDTTDDSTDTTDDSSTSTTSVDTIKSYFSKFSGVNITSDDTNFYIESYSWPEHGMGTGITAWQEQVPIPQDYTGSNSWTIPLNPVKSDSPLDTSEHLMKGAMAVAVNGVPIFNVFNNKGVNAFLAGELDDWGGHFGRGDDYHYHLVPTHLEETVGKTSPLAYALDGYPVYGYTDETLDNAFGRTDEAGNYRYHASNVKPYFIPFMMGKITLDPSTLAPEDQIFPQPVQNPVRPSNEFKAIEGSEVYVFGVKETGQNAFSFEYSITGVSGTKYYVNYSWDTNCGFTYVYVDENGGTTNLPTNGSIGAGTGNTESYSNVKFCADVSLGDGGSLTGDDTTDSSGDTTDSTSSGYTVVSTSSNFSFSSIAIDANGEILADFQCEQKENGVEKSIPLAWNNVPEGTAALAISIHGFPKPNETNSYLTLWGIAPSVTSISHGGADDGDWYIGPNKDGAALSYSSPCNPSAGTTEYYITLYALNQTPASLPTESSLEIDYDKLVEAIATVTVIDSIQIAYKSVSSN